MSCLWDEKNQAEETNCPCDRYIHPPGLNIPAGLDTIPRQIAAFPEFRKAMLHDVRSQCFLFGWRARGGDDLGIMLLEMWAYVCDSLSFYDEVIANEAYLRTARLRPSLRKLTGLLGYLPRPAVAASVRLTLLAEGRNRIAIPSGMAFRSGAFDGEAPQVFELNEETSIHPFFNSWTLYAGRTVLGVTNPEYLLIKPAAKLSAGDPLLVIDLNQADHTQARTVESIGTHTGAAGVRYTKVSFRNQVFLPKSTNISRIRLLIPRRMTALCKTGTAIGTVISKGKRRRTYLTLDALYRQIKPEDYVIVSRGTKNRWFKVKSVEEVIRSAGNDTTITINGSTFEIPAVKFPLTRIILDASLNSRKEIGDTTDWDNDDRSQIVVHYGMIDAGQIVADRQTTLRPDDPLKLESPLEEPLDGKSPGCFQMEDKNQTGLDVSGELDFMDRELNLDMGTSWDPPLVHPVQVYGNIVSVSRGETVLGEILGSGDASIANQSFALKKKPLTYLPAPTADNDLGVKSTLRVFVNGVLWKDVRSFFNIGPDEQVYIIRQDDKSESTVIFGDGLRGARLPTGRENVIADYRYGAGAASPPDGSITQLAKPVKGVKSVKNPVAASGGDDAEAAENVREYAPGSALILGRAVSIQDMEAVAARVSGVRAVQVEWRWHERRQRPVVQVWYIGEAGIEPTIEERLRDVSDPSTPIDVDRANGQETKLSLDVEIDERLWDDDVLASLRKALMDKKTGLLAPERIGIGKPLFRSRIFETALSVEGVTAISGIYWKGEPFASFSKKPDAGKYFDLEKGSLVLNRRGG